MALHRCPECRKKISDSLEQCIHCGFSFKTADLEIYKQKLVERQQQNQQLNRQSTKLNLIWLAIFTAVIVIAAMWQA